MSLQISYFFNYPKDLISTAEDINHCLGCTLSPYQGDDTDWFARFLGMEFSLYTTEHLENDRELDFENFSYVLDFRTPWGAANFRPVQLTSLVVVVFALYRSYGIAGMLVYDGQILLARYEKRTTPQWGQILFDMVSNAPFIGFGSHLEQLEARMPEDWRLYTEM